MLSNAFWFSTNKDYFYNLGQQFSTWSQFLWHFMRQYSCAKKVQTLNVVCVNFKQKKTAHKRLVKLTTGPMS